MNNKNIFIAFFLIIANCLFSINTYAQGTSYCQCVDSGFLYRAPITITNSSGNSLTNYQVLINIPYVAGNMNSDFSDLRFRDSSCTDLYYWVESYTASSSAKVWVKVSSIPIGGTTIYMYYGNAAAVTASDGNNTFDAFDFTTFTEVDPNNRLTVIPSRVTFTDLYKNENTYLYKQVLPITGYHYNFEYMITGGSSIPNDDGYALVGGLADSAATLDKVANALFVRNYNAFHISTYRLYMQKMLSNIESTILPSCPACYASPALNQLYYVTITRCDSIVTMNFYSDSARTIHITGSPITGIVSPTVSFNYILPLTSFFNGQTIGVNSGYVQNIRVRKYACSEPVPTIGSQVNDTNTSLTATITPASQSICSGASVTLTASGGVSYNWSTGAGSASITVNPATTTTYTATVTNASGCSATAVSTVTVNALPTPAITGTLSYCEGSNTTLTTGGYNSYQWSNGSTNQSTIVTIADNPITVTVTDANGCTQTQTQNVTQNPGPNVTATATSTNIIIGNNTQLTATGGGTYLWTPAIGLSCDTCANSNALPTVTTTYCVRVTDANGCADSACIKITIETPCGELFVPTAFSPNNDGANELECVSSKCIQDFYFAIYDRWGEKVFESTDQKKCWDGTYKGKLMNTAVFVYFMKATLTTGEIVTKKGNISLIR